MELVSTPLLPSGFRVPASRWTHPSATLRRKMETQPYVFGPGVFDPHGAQLVMYHGLDAVYLSGYSFAIGHLGTTDMDLYSSVEIADGARRIVSALRKFQLTMAVGDPHKGEPPRHLEIPPVVADMDVGNRDFVVIARTDGVSATDAPEPARGLRLAIDRGLRYLDSGVPDLLWCEFPTAERGPTETFHEEIRKRFPKARFAFNYSSSFKWFNEKDPITWEELGLLGVGFIFITLALQHAAGHGISVLLKDLKDDKEEGYMALQRKEWAEDADVPTRSHHLFTGVPYHQHVGQQYGASRLSEDMDENLEISKVV